MAEQRTIVIDDVDADPQYLAVVPGAKSQLSVPLRNKGQVIGALNLLSDKLASFSERDEWILRQFGAHVAQAITTFFQLLVDMKNAQIPGSYQATRHDYRPDLTRFINEVPPSRATPSATS